jgi:acetoin utilization protein AcuB
MSQDAYAVPPGTSLAEVARTMATHKYGSAVIARGGRVEGIFTTVDALKALDALLSTSPAAEAPAPRRKAPTRKAAARKAAAKKASPARRPARKAAGKKKAPARKRSRR